MTRYIQYECIYDYYYYCCKVFIYINIFWETMENRLACWSFHPLLVYCSIRTACCVLETMIMFLLTFEYCRRNNNNKKNQRYIKSRFVWPKFIPCFFRNFEITEIYQEEFFLFYIFVKCFLVLINSVLYHLSHWTSLLKILPNILYM